MNLVKINSINIWDEEWENCFYDEGDAGRKKSSDNCLGCENHIAVLPSQDLYLNVPNNANFYVLLYDSNKTYLSYTVGRGSRTISVPSNCYYVTFYSYNSYGTTYHNDIQICLNSESQKTTYHPHWVLGLDGQGKAFTADISSMLPSYMGMVDLGTLNWSMERASLFACRFDLTTKSGDAYGRDGICEKYICKKNANNLWNNSESGMSICPTAISSNNFIFVRDNNYSDAQSFKSSLQNILLFYHKVTA